MLFSPRTMTTTTTTTMTMTMTMTMLVWARPSGVADWATIEEETSTDYEPSQISPSIGASLYYIVLH